jgi:hypothetical protein
MTPCCKVRTTNISEVSATFIVRVNFTPKREAAEFSYTLVYMRFIQKVSSDELLEKKTRMYFQTIYTAI